MESIIEDINQTSEVSGILKFNFSIHEQLFYL